MNNYILNQNVLYFYKNISRTAETIIVENNKKEKSYVNCLKLLKNSCKWYGCSYHFQRDFVVDKLNFCIKTPIILNSQQALIFFPTASPKSDKCVWICYNNIERYTKNNSFTKIYFKNGKIINFDISYTIIDNQITKCIKIEKIVNELIKKK